MDEIADVMRGRRVLLSLITAVLLVDAGVSMLWLTQMPAGLVSSIGQIAVVKRAGRFLVTLLLMLLVYRGNSVAIVITIVLFCLATLIAIPATLETPLLFPLLALYGVFPIVLMFSEDVGAFLEQQRRQRSSSDQADEPAS